MIDFGIVKPGRTLYVPFDSFAGSTGASITLTGLAVTDIEIYKDGSVTQRSSDNGYTLLDTDGIDFDGITGIHGFSVSLADNSDAGFYAAGSRYFIVVSSVTVDSQTVSFVAATFAIGHPDAVLNTTIATLSSQTSFTLTAGPAEDDALNDTWLVVHDVASAVQMAIGVISDYTGATKTVTLAAAPTFTIAATDNISVMGPMPLQPTVSQRRLDVSSGGEAGVDWANVGSPTTTLNLSGTTVKTATDVETDTADIQTRLPAALVGGRIDSNVGAISSDATAADNAEAFFDGTGYAGTGNVIPTVTTLTNDPSGVTTLLSRVPSGIFTGITSLAQWLGLIAGKQTGNSTARTEIRATGGGSGTYDETTDSLEANRDNIGTAGAGLTAADDAVITAVATLNNLSAAQVNAEVVDALATDTYAEPGQGTPAATLSLAAKINYLFKNWRNRKTQTSTTWSLYNDDTTTVDQKATVSDDGTTAGKTEIATGP